MRAGQVWCVIFAGLLLLQGCRAALIPATAEPAAADKVCLAGGFPMHAAATSQLHSVCLLSAGARQPLQQPARICIPGAVS
jgi:hypothetical protein